MRCSACGVHDFCWYNTQRQLVCRDCLDREERDAWRAKVIGQRRIWYKCVDQVHKRVPVTVIDTRQGWLIVRDDAGVNHRVRPHNTEEMETTCRA